MALCYCLGVDGGNVPISMTPIDWLSQANQEAYIMSVTQRGYKIGAELCGWVSTKYSLNTSARFHGLLVDITGAVHSSKLVDL